MLHALFAGLYMVMIAKLAFGESMITIAEAAAGAAAGARQARVEASRVRERGGRRGRADPAPAAPAPRPGPDPGDGPPAMPSRRWWARVRDAAAAGAAAARAHRPAAPAWRLRLYRQPRRQATPQPPPQRTGLPGEREGFAEGEFADSGQPFVAAAARPGPGTVDAELIGPASLPPPSRTELPGERLTALPVPGREPFTTPVAVAGSPQRMPVTGPAPPALEAPAAFTLPAAIFGPPGHAVAAGVTAKGTAARWLLPAAAAQPAAMAQPASPPPPIPAPATGGTAMTGASRRYALPAGSTGAAVAARPAGRLLPAAGANHGHFEQLTARIREEVASQAGCIATLAGRLADADVGDFHLTVMRAWLDRYLAVRQAIIAAEDEIGRTVGQYVTAVDSVPGGPRNSASPVYLDRF